MNRIIQQALIRYQNSASGRKREKLSRRLKSKPVKAKLLRHKTLGKRKATRTKEVQLAPKRSKSARSLVR